MQHWAALLTGELGNMSNHAQRAHSELGASSSERWQNCPGSVRLSAGVSDPGSVYAAEGTAAHELGEWCLRNLGDAAERIGDEWPVDNHKFTVDEDMANAVQMYVDFVRAEQEKGGRVMIEQRFDLSEQVWPGMYGTADAVIYHPESQELVVADYKHGQGYAVEADANPQLLYYAIGAASLIKAPVKKVTVAIVQPRAFHKSGPIRSWSCSTTDLFEYVGVLRAAAQATEDPNAPLNPGAWCKFCKARGFCPALRDEAIAASNVEFTTVPDTLTSEQLGEILEKATLIEDWISAVRAEALRRAEMGVPPSGWKLVQKRATRRWAFDEEDTADRLRMAYSLPDEKLFTRKLATPAQVEKLLPKKLKESLADLVVKESSGVTLARESDPREAVASGLEFQPVEA